MAENFGTATDAGTNGGRYDFDNQDEVCAGQTTKFTTTEEAQATLKAACAKASEATNKFKYGGTTATIAAITPADKRLTIAQIGDSPILVIIHDENTKQNQIIDLTKDHSPEVHKEQIEAAGGKVKENGYLSFITDNGDELLLAMARALGDTPFKNAVSTTPDITSYDLKQHEADGKHIYIVPLTDGIHDHSKPNSLYMLSQEEVALCIDINKSPEENAQAIKDKALNKAHAAGGADYKSDNMSVVVVKYDPDASKATLGAVYDGHFRIAGGHVADAAKRATQAETGLETSEPRPRDIPNIEDLTYDEMKEVQKGVTACKAFNTILGEGTVKEIEATDAGTLKITTVAAFDAANLGQMNIENAETLEGTPTQTASGEAAQTYEIPPEKLPTVLCAHFGLATKPRLQMVPKPEGIEAHIKEYDTKTLRVLNRMFAGGVTEVHTSNEEGEIDHMFIVKPGKADMFMRAMKLNPDDIETFDAGEVLGDVEGTAIPVTDSELPIPFQFKTFLEEKRQKELLDRPSVS